MSMAKADRKNINTLLQEKRFDEPLLWHAWTHCGYSDYHQRRLGDKKRSMGIERVLRKGSVYSKTSPYGHEVDQDQFQYTYACRDPMGNYADEHLDFWDTPIGFVTKDQFTFASGQLDDVEYKILQQKIKDYRFKKASENACQPMVFGQLVFLTSPDYLETVVSNGIQCVPLKRSGDEVWIVTKAKHMPHMGTFGNGASDVNVFQCEGYKALWNGNKSEYHVTPSVDGRHPNKHTFWVSRIGDEPIPLATYASEQDEDFSHKTVVAPCLRKGAKAIAEAISTLRD